MARSEKKPLDFDVRIPRYCVVAEELSVEGNSDHSDLLTTVAVDVYEQLQKSEPKKSLLKTLWQGTLAALPTLKELPHGWDRQNR